MAEDYIRQLSKKTWYRWSFYINIVLFFIVALFIYLLTVDSLNAGYLYNTNQDAMLLIARDVAFLAIALALIFFQFFRNLLMIIRRSI
jgi:hypothetical protein